MLLSAKSNRVRRPGSYPRPSRAAPSSWPSSSPVRLGFFVTIILVQGLVAYVQLSLSAGSPLALAPYLVMLALLSLYLLFYLALTLMLGAFFDSRGPVLGIAIGVAIASMIGVGNLFAGFLPWLGFAIAGSDTRHLNASGIRRTAAGRLAYPYHPDLCVLAVICRPGDLAL